MRGEDVKELKAVETNCRPSSGQKPIAKCAQQPDEEQLNGRVYSFTAPFLETRACTWYVLQPHLPPLIYIVWYHNNAVKHEPSSFIYIRLCTHSLCLPS